MMQSSTLTTTLLWKKWIIWILASSLGFFILFLRFTQGRQPAAIFLPTAHDVEQLPASTKQLPLESKFKVAAPESSMESSIWFSPQPSVEERASTPSHIALPPESSVEESAVPPSSVRFYADSSVDERALPPSNTEFCPQPSEEELSPLSSAEEMFLSQQSIHGSPQPSLELYLEPQAVSVIPPRYKKELLSPRSNDLHQVPSLAENSSQSNALDLGISKPRTELPSQIISVNIVSTHANTEPAINLQGKTSPPAEKPTRGNCDIFDGRWVYDLKNYPLYRARSCPFLSDQVSCQKNGRPDSNYEHWRWEPRGCKLPRFNGKKMLERLRGKRLVIVGDSLNRNQWESLACLLYSSTRRRRAYVRTAIDHRIFKALDHHCTVEFFWSPFLIKLEEKGRKKVLKLDTLPASSWHWRGADAIVFNTGHWWTHHGRLRTWNYYEYNGELVEMKESQAYEIALKTWAHWVDKWVDPTKTTVFFRSISPEHKWRNLHWCYNQTHPLTSEIYKQTFPRSMMSTVVRTIQNMRTPIKYLNITSLSEYRRDAHTSVYTTRKGKLLTADQLMQPRSFADCSHWCLPGLPDTWNVLLYATMIGLPAAHV